MEPQPIEISAFVTTTLGFLVFLIGVQVTRRVRFLRDFSIPEPVTGGLVAALVTLAIYLLLDRRVEFDLAVRDYLLVLFFSAIGLNARLSDLRQGGGALAILLGLTLATITFQNVIGVVTAVLFGLPAQLGVMLGSAALIGGHGTAIAWSPEVVRVTGLASAGELGVAVATLGLVVASLVGGPIARHLIEGRGLTPDRPDEDPTLGLAFEDEAAEKVTHVDLTRALLWLHLVMIAGYAVADVISDLGLKLPPFVPCMLMGIMVGNLLPVLFPRYSRISRTPSLSLLSDFALGTFLAMSLMALQLWTLAGSAGLLVTALVLQMLAVTVFVLFVLFKTMGSGYRAAVLASGFAGFSLGATPTAIANMNAVTKRYGPSPIAFLILPLVSAFFVDLANAVAIQTILGL
jgi:ESS family glutamate:Na+ symporter